MELRMRFVNAVLAGEDSMTALCEEYEVSRKTGYKWLSQFQAQGPAGLAERSRAPRVVRDSNIAFFSPAQLGIHSEAEVLSRAPGKKAR